MIMTTPFPIFLAVVLLAGAAAGSKCFECRSVCFNASPAGIQNDKVDELNKAHCAHCSGMSEEGIDSKDCGEARCFSALALVKKTTEDGLTVTVNYTERGCIPTCPTALCDLAQLESCNFSQKVSADLVKRVAKGQSDLTATFKFVKSDWKDRGEGGELHCCSEDLCNTHSETVLAHKTIHEDL